MDPPGKGGELPKAVVAVAKVAVAAADDLAAETAVKVDKAKGRGDAVLAAKAPR